MTTVLSSIELRRLRDLGEALVDSRPRAPGSGVAYEPLLPALTASVNATRFTVHRPVVGPEGCDLEFHGYWSAFPGAHDECRRFHDAVGQRRTAWVFDPAVPQVEQRNRVLRLDELPYPATRRRLQDFARAMGVGSGMDDQLRMLVCDGPRLLAFVGAFRDVPFDERDHAAFVALAPAFKRAVLADRAARDRAFLAVAIEAALEAFGEPAFLLDARRVIRHASRAGEEWTRRVQDARDRIVAVACGRSSEGSVHLLPDGRGAIVVIRTAGPRPSVRLRRAQERWDLSRRQIEVLAHVVDGRTNKEIATTLRCTEGNVELHVTNILRRSGASNRTELVASYWRL